MIIDVALYRIGVGHNGGKATDQLDGLAHHILQRGVVRAVVVAVHGQHAALELVHDVRGGGLEDHILEKAVRKAAGRGEDPVEALELLGGGQLPEQEKVGHLLIAEGARCRVAVHDLAHADAPVKEFSGDGDLFHVPHQIALHAADAGHAGDHAGAVGVAKALLDRGALVIARIDRIFAAHFGAQSFHIAVEFGLFADHPITSSVGNLCHSISRRARFCKRKE